MPLTEDELRDIEARAEAATPGPWFVVGDTWRAADQAPYVLSGTDDPHGGNPLCDMLLPDTYDSDDAADEAEARAEADARFIAAARQDIPRLAAALREAWEDGKRLQDEVGNLEAAVRQADATLKLHGLVDTGGQDLLVKLNEDTMAKLIACESRALAAEAAAAAMRERLLFLSNEVLGSLSIMEPLVRREIGNTNYACLMQRAEEAREALRSPTPGAALLAERDRLRDMLTIALSFAEHSDFTSIYDKQGRAVPRDVWIDETSRWLDDPRAALKETSNG